MFQLSRGERNECGRGMKLDRQLNDFGNTRNIEIVLSRFGIAARHSFGVVMRLAGEQGVMMVRLDQVRQCVQLQRMEMPAVLMGLQFAVVRVDVFGMIMSEHPETEVERP